MKATQLRLGNYLQGKNTVVKITRIFNEDEIGIGSGDPYTVSGENPCLLPIPLTEEWLLKCGFVIVHKHNKHFSILHPKGIAGSYKIHIFKSVNDLWHLAFSDMVQGKEIDYIPCVHITYIHQLQNLYFTLTGEELNIEL